MLCKVIDQLGGYYIGKFCFFEKVGFQMEWDLDGGMLAGNYCIHIYLSSGLQMDSFSFHFSSGDVVRHR